MTRSTETKSDEVAALASPAAATYIGVSRKTLSNWRALGEGPLYVRIGRVGARIVYRVSDLDQFLADHLVHPTKPTTHNEKSEPID